MPKARTAAVLAVLACSLVFVAVALAAFQNRQWAGQNQPYHLNSGQSGYLNVNVFLNEASGKGENRAVCAGINGFGDTCVGRGETARFGTKGIEVEGDPYLHDHDGEGGYFKGWFFGEY